MFLEQEGFMRSRTHARECRRAQNHRIPIQHTKHRDPVQCAHNRFLHCLISSICFFSNWTPSVIYWISFQRIANFIYFPWVFFSGVWMVNGSAFPSTLASTGTVMRTLRSTVVAERGSNVKLVCNGNNVQPLDTTLKWTFNTHKMKHNGYRNIKIVWRPERQAFYSLNSRHTEYINAYHSGFWLLNSSPQMPVPSQ